jgi:hypothetical protein
MIASTQWPVTTNNTVNTARTPAIKAARRRTSPRARALPPTLIRSSLCRTPGPSHHAGTAASSGGTRSARASRSRSHENRRSPRQLGWLAPPAHARETEPRLGDVRGACPSRALTRRRGGAHGARGRERPGRDVPASSRTLGRALSRRGSASRHRRGAVLLVAALSGLPREDPHASLLALVALCHRRGLTQVEASFTRGLWPSARGDLPPTRTQDVDAARLGAFALLYGSATAHERRERVGALTSLAASMTILVRWLKMHDITASESLPVFSLRQESLARCPSPRRQD